MWCCSQKSSSYSTPTTEGTTTSQGLGTGSGLEYTGTGSGTEYGAGSGTGAGTEYGAGSGTGAGGETMLADGSWLAGLAMGDSYKTTTSALQSAIMAFTTTLVLIFALLHL
ncbi:hypothetical protein OIU74_004068 [Salix koriyanagi]|uniref:Uncharacterized protein n=1 Tax=Salix koriyanagi TaxID=2511006 RepID=A0A9Q0UZ95_9ROSI|nr:hypothetical protein OIU74_004068 [Salix koriyanagi]